MASWLRFRHEGRTGFGTLGDADIEVCDGDMFGEATPTGQRLALGDVELLAPCEPTVMVGLWNNVASAAAEQGRSKPPEPLYFFKPPSCFLAPGGVIRQPRSHDGRVIFEAELGVVIGRRCVDVAEDEADDVIFGYTCVNDVTAPVVLREDETFDQWCRCKSFDTFGPFGPVIATEVELSGMRIRARLEGETLQDYPADDLFYSPQQLVARISRDMTLNPGDIISCGTAAGTTKMPPGSTVEIDIDGIGVLRNTFQG